MRWQDGPQPHAMLSAISVFDSDCASVHVKEKNEVAFRPFGLDVPDELAHACQEVKDLITTEQKQLEKARNPIFAAPTWKATTTVGKTLAALSAGTDIKAIEGLAKLTDDETLRLERLRDDLAKNPAKASAEQTLKADNVKRVIDAVKAINSVSTDDALVSLAAAFREARIKRGAARVAAERAFGAEAVAGVGGEIWRELWESAKRYSVTTAFPEQPFPPSAADAHCVLCLQPLSQDAINRMARFEEFIQQDTELQAQKAERAARDARLTASRVRMQTLGKR
ncbi:hypothetical protein C6Q07_33015 [Burkholderia multivorans]|nr:hypothetical protein C6Q07_33015 [Burkholderia multivorans]